MAKLPEDILREYCTTEEEYAAITKEYKKMQKYYEYIRGRKSRNKLTEEQISKCKEGNVGGIFGYSKEVEDLMQKYGAEGEEILGIIRKYDTKEELKKEIEKLAKYYRIDERKIVIILNRYDTMDNFISEYFNEGIYFNSEIVDTLRKGLIDINLKENIGIENLLREIYKIGEGDRLSYIYDLDKMLEIINNVLNERNKKIIIEKYGIEGEKKTGQQIAEEFRCTTSNVYEIIKTQTRKIYEALKKEENVIYDIQEGLTDEERQLIISYLGNTIFVPDEKYKNEPSTGDIKKIIGIIGRATVEKKEIKEIGGDEEFRKKNGKFLHQQQKTKKELIDLIKQIDNITIEELNLESDKSYEILRKNGVEKIGDMLMLNEDDFYNIDGFLACDLEKVLRYFRTYSKLKDKIIDREIGIEAIDLSVRAYNGLKKAGINSISDLILIIEKDEEGLEKIRSLGEKSIQEILSKVEEYKSKRYKIFAIEEQIERERIEREQKEKEQKEKELAEYMQEGVDGDTLLNRIDSIEIEYMDLSARAYNCLKRARINNIGDLINEVDEKHIFNIRFLGKKTLQEILSKLEKYKTKREKIIAIREQIEREQKEKELVGYIQEDAQLDEILSKLERLDNIQENGNKIVFADN